MDISKMTVTVSMKDFQAYKMAVETLMKIADYPIAFDTTIHDLKKCARVTLDELSTMTGDK